MRIQILKEETANKIAAGEIVENPAAVIKELVENSLDAGSKNVRIYIEKAGMERIRVIDDGIGIYPDDIELAFARHATNKINKESNLNEIKTLGFRGEALASIAAVSKIELKTRQKDQDEGTRAFFEAGKMIKKEPCGCPRGTDIEVFELFYNTPVRFKFLQKKQNELSRITDIINKLSLGNPGVSFNLIHEGRQLLKTTGKGDLLEVIASIYGFQTVKQMIELKSLDFNQQHDGERNIVIKGYISKPELTRSSRNYQVFVVNGRYIRSKLLTEALEDGYKGMLPRGRFPLAVVEIEIPYNRVDVNVHPAKLHIRFDQGNKIVEALKYTVKESLEENELIPRVQSVGNKKGREPGQNNSKQREMWQKLETKEEYGREETGIETSKQGVIEEEILPGNYQEYDSFEPGAGFSGDYIKETAEQAYDETDGEVLQGEDSDFLPGDSSKTLDLFEVPWKDYKIAGQVFLTYWIIEREDNLFFVDQHAAHERINYEKLLQSHRESSIISQNIIPFTLELDSSELLLMENNLENIRELGLELDVFGNNTLLVRAVPYVVKDVCDGTFVRDFITALASVIRQESGSVCLEMSRLEEVLISVACTKSVKANQKLSREEFENLMTELKKVSNPYTCPHGRPTIISFTRKDIEKYFKRIL